MAESPSTLNLPEVSYSSCQSTFSRKDNGDNKEKKATNRQRRPFLSFLVDCLNPPQEFLHKTSMEFRCDKNKAGL